MLGPIAEYLKGRLQQRLDLVPLGFSWIFVVTVDVLTVGILLVATLQRIHVNLPAALIACGVTFLPHLVYVPSPMKFKPALTWATATIAVAIFLFAAGPVDSDFAPFLLALMVGTVSAVSSTWAGAATAICAAATLLVAAEFDRLDKLAVYLPVLGAGWMIGLMLRAQQKLIVELRETQAALAEHAVADERRRIAREVHDVIAHSLSITLLHVTAARRGLQQDGDIDDAVEALEQAEGLGRHAMSDIRRTVGLLDSGPMPTEPEPTIGDIESLVADFRRAGLTVDLQTEGDVESVSAAVGLALYRIAQESLANIAKHAPDSDSSVRLIVTRRTAKLTVTNRLAAVVLAGPSQGHGIAGMRQRVELLDGVIEVGPTDDEWRVRASLPLDTNGFRPPWCKS